ncbi:MAG TPA: LLM class F420-dependent oxidoreductase, partial [Candidatus Binataceae bacterium]|nr:LLM class F420-dependent oxidoreductase [Candidatus Binataceae bacterium]
MKLGLFAMIGAVAEPMAIMKTLAQRAEDRGFSTIWAPEHVVLVEKYASRYPYSETGAFPGSTTATIADPFIALTAMASATSRIRLATGICLVPEHNPVVLAKVVSTLDWLSGGRVVLGAGIGWLEEEFHAIGIPWERRAARTRECVESMRRLWGDELSSYRGEFVNFEGVRSYPKPVRGSVPVIFGGESGPALKRSAEYGNGWFGFNVSPDEAVVKVKRIEEILRTSGRKRSEMEIIVAPYTKPATPDDLKRYRDAGVDEVVIVNPRAP